MPLPGIDAPPKYEPPIRWIHSLPFATSLGTALLMGAGIWALVALWQGRDQASVVVLAMVGLGFVGLALFDEVRAIRRDVALLKYQTDYLLLDSDGGISVAALVEIRRRLRTALNLPPTEWQ
jgi:hypothetical protein